jgi:hypothetical protein
MSAALRFFVGFTRLENVHPLQGGLIRFKYRADRRPGSPIQPVWRFYPDYARETVTNLLRRGRIVLRLDRLRRSIEKDPNRRAYTDRALTLVDSDADTLRLLTRDRTEPNAFEVSEQLERARNSLPGETPGRRPARAARRARPSRIVTRHIPAADQRARTRIGPSSP